MAIFDLKANIDLKQNLNLYTTCKQLDSLNLILSVFDNSVQADLANYNVRLKAMKADKVPLIQEHSGVSISSNVITIKTDEQLTTTSGKTLIELQFIDKETGKKKATFNLVLIVVSNPLEVDRSISKATYTLLEELENRLDQVSDFFENIEKATTSNNSLKETITKGEETKNNLDTAITNASNKKSEVDEAVNKATNKITELENSINNANKSKTELDTSKTVADTTKIDLDNANVQAEKNIEELNKIGDATDLATKVETNTENIYKNVKSIEDVNSQLTNITKTITDLNTNKANKSDILACESGTFTPYLFGDKVAGNNNYKQQKGFYTKIGKRVHLDIVIAINSLDTAMNGQIKVGGLPFVTTSAYFYRGNAILGYNTLIPLDNTYYAPIGFISQKENAITLAKNKIDGSGIYYITKDALNNAVDKMIFMSLEYITD